MGIVSLKGSREEEKGEETSRVEKARGKATETKRRKSISGLQ